MKKVFNYLLKLSKKLPEIISGAFQKISRSLLIKILKCAYKAIFGLFLGLTCTLFAMFLITYTSLYFTEHAKLANALHIQKRYCAYVHDISQRAIYASLRAVKQKIDPVLTINTDENYDLLNHKRHIVQNQSSFNNLYWNRDSFIRRCIANLVSQNNTEIEESYTYFLIDLYSDQISSVFLDKNTIHAEWVDGTKTITALPPSDQRDIVNRLLSCGVNISAQAYETEDESALKKLGEMIYDNWMNILALCFILWWFSGGNISMMTGGLSKNKPREFSKNVTVRFTDVAGCEEAKQEVAEVVDFLKAPSQFENSGCRIPRGVLFIGPPGTGKTLLAKAVAGEAGVSFINISGSEFVEMFVGVGAGRVRDLFKQARKSSPCILFIDEIDGVGRKRGAGYGGGNDEREQTLNQLLVEMDGFEEKSRVVVIAASNRPDILDPALLRPARFDRQVMVTLPDKKGRMQILEVHIRKLKTGTENIDTEKLAKSTAGFSGADLSNLVNEASLIAARAGRPIHMGDFDKAKDKVMLGPEKQSMLMTKEDKTVTAYHEAGHAIVGLIVPGHDPIHKVTIVPRGKALGVTVFLPRADKYSYSRKYLEAQLAGLFGGRVPEELVLERNKSQLELVMIFQQQLQLLEEWLWSGVYLAKLGLYLMHQKNMKNF